MKQIIGWIMILISLIVLVIMYAPLIGIAKSLLMLLSIFLSCVWVGIAVEPIKSCNDKKGTDDGGRGGK